jgi:hypothetical protein
VTRQQRGLVRRRTCQLVARDTNLLRIGTGVAGVVGLGYIQEYRQRLQAKLLRCELASLQAVSCFCAALVCEMSCRVHKAQKAKVEKWVVGSF